MSNSPNEFLPTFPEPQAGTLPCARGQSGAFSQELVGYPNAELRFGKAEGNRLGRKQAVPQCALPYVCNQEKNAYSGMLALITKK